MSSLVVLAMQNSHLIIGWYSFWSVGSPDSFRDLMYQGFNSSESFILVVSYCLLSVSIESCWNSITLWFSQVIFIPSIFLSISFIFSSTCFCISSYTLYNFFLVLIVKRLSLYIPISSPSLKQHSRSLLTYDRLQSLIIPFNIWYYLYSACLSPCRALCSFQYSFSLNLLLLTTYTTCFNSACRYALTIF